MITSASNEKIRQTAALIARHKERRATGLFTAEGVKLFLEAPQDSVVRIFVSESFEKEQKDLLAGREHYIVKNEVFAKLCDTRTPQGILTVLKQPVHTTEELLAGTAKDRLLLVLEDVQDPGNVGTILRTAEGAGAAGVILGRGCADIFAPKTIRSTMGSVFRVPFVYEEDLGPVMDRVRAAGITSYAAHLDGSTEFDTPDYRGGCALLIGNEGSGLSAGLTAKADVLVRIPMEGKLESLNAAVAAGIMMYTIYRKQKKRN